MYCSLEFNIRNDVAGATIMAASTSSPELFINCIGTFVTKNSLGVGTIVGSSVFNILAVPACCGIFLHSQIIQIDWWPLTRDCFMYGVSVIALIFIFVDDVVMWHEALTLFIMYILYIIAMCYNDQMSYYAHRLVTWCQNKRTGHRIFKEVSELSPLVPKGELHYFSKFFLKVKRSLYNSRRKRYFYFTRRIIIFDYLSFHDSGIPRSWSALLPNNKNSIERLEFSLHAKFIFRII